MGEMNIYVVTMHGYVWAFEEYTSATKFLIDAGMICSVAGWVSRHHNKITAKIHEVPLQ